MACKLKIIYEDDEIIVINKPAGLLTISTEKEKEKTAFHMVLNYVKTEDPEARIFVVHRLDKDTSGIVMFAKNPELKEAFQENWNELVSLRQYIAIADGIFEKKEDTITSYLAETRTHLIYSTQNKLDGKMAITHYKVINENKDFSLVEVKIDTGRKNQIRVHLKESGHPVAGDKKYGSITDPIKRMALHCSTLTLKHPFTGKELSFSAHPDNRFYSLFN